MIAIADSGSSKIDWAVIDGPRIAARFTTAGVNPAVMPPEVLREALSGARTHLEAVGPVRKLWFYGAGCLPELEKPTAALLCETLPAVKEAEVASDLLGAARSLLGREPGIACILGTGSNSCLYNGSVIADNVSPLGFILGDEASGAALGKRFVADVFKRRLPEDVCRGFMERYGLDRAEVIRRVYREPAANRFLASFAPFIKEHLAVAEVRQPVVEAMRSFISRNLSNYAGFGHLPLRFCGSIAANFADCLREAAQAEGCTIDRIEQSPIEGLLKYHTPSINHHDC